MYFWKQKFTTLLHTTWKPLNPRLFICQSCVKKEALEFEVAVGGKEGDDGDLGFVVKDGVWDLIFHETLRKSLIAAIVAALGSFEKF